MNILLKLYKPLIPKLYFSILGALAGGIISGIGSAVGAKQSADSAEWSTRKQIEWEREKMQNAHQWEVQDLEKAGLNKVLTVNGSGAIGGSITPPQSQQGELTAQGAENMARSINNAYTIHLQKRQLEAQAKVAEAQADKAQAEADDIRDNMRPGGIKEQSLINSRMNYWKTQSETNLARAQELAQKEQAELYKKYGRETIVKTQKHIAETVHEEVKTAIDIYTRDISLPQETIGKWIKMITDIISPIATAYGIRGMLSPKMVRSMANREIHKNLPKKPNFIMERGKEYVNFKTGEIYNP